MLSAIVLPPIPCILEVFLVIREQSHLTVVTTGRHARAEIQDLPYTSLIHSHCIGSTKGKSYLNCVSQKTCTIQTVVAICLAHRRQTLSLFRKNKRTRLLPHRELNTTLNLTTRLKLHACVLFHQSGCVRINITRLCQMVALVQEAVQSGIFCDCSQLEYKGSCFHGSDLSDVESVGK